MDVVEEMETAAVNEMLPEAVKILKFEGITPADVD